MNCERCKLGNQSSWENTSSSVVVDGCSFSIIRCRNCSFCIGFEVAEGRRTIEEILKSDFQVDGLHPAITTQDKIIHHVLRQYLHNENENLKEDIQQVVFDVPDEHDVVMILWQNGTAVGFYTLKLQGTYIEETGEMYAFTTLDTIFVHQLYRRSGYCQKMLNHICTSHSDQDIGISKPISSAMKAALQTFLTSNPQMRRKIWEVDGTGGEGCRKLVWLALSAEKRNLNVGKENAGFDTG